MAAQLYEVIETSFTAIAPVVDMVGIDKACFATTGKATALIAQGQRAANRGRDRTRLAPYVQHGA